MPQENPTFYKTDEDTFYIFKNTGEQFSASGYSSQVQALRDRIDQIVTTLQGASAVGVSGADTALAAIKGQPLSTILG